MKIIISDSSTLILLQKIDLLHLLLKDHTLIISREVYNEVVIKGKIKYHEDAFFIEEYINNKKITLLDVKNDLMVKQIIKDYGVHLGEAQSIVLYLETKSDVVAVDDHKAINICRILKIPFMTALSFIIFFYKEKLISKKKSKLSIELLYQYGRYKDEIILEALKVIENGL